MKKFIPELFVILVVYYLLFLVKPAILGQLGGTFKAKAVPQEYVVLKDFIDAQDQFFRTLWIPKRQRFGFFNNNHPAIESPNLLSEEELAVRGVKYVIIPYDSEGEIFLKDRQYDHGQRLALEGELDKITWLKKISLSCSNDLNHCSKIAIYQTSGYQDHFFAVGEELPEIAWKMINPTKYLVEVKNAIQPFTLVFSETYDELWQAKIDGQKITSQKFAENLNSFAISKSGSYNIEVYFEPQGYVYSGLVVSLLTLLTSGFLLLRSRKTKNG